MGSHHFPFPFEVVLLFLLFVFNDSRVEKQRWKVAKLTEVELRVKVWENSNKRKQESQTWVRSWVALNTMLKNLHTIWYIMKDEAFAYVSHSNLLCPWSPERGSFGIEVFG